MLSNPPSSALNSTTGTGPVALANQPTINTPTVGDGDVRLGSLVRLRNTGSMLNVLDDSTTVTRHVKASGIVAPFITDTNPTTGSDVGAFNGNFQWVFTSGVDRVAAIGKYSTKGVIAASGSVIGISANTAIAGGNFNTDCYFTREGAGDFSAYSGAQTFKFNTTNGSLMVKDLAGATGAAVVMGDLSLSYDTANAALFVCTASRGSWRDIRCGSIVSGNSVTAARFTVTTAPSTSLPAFLGQPSGTSGIAWPSPTYYAANAETGFTGGYLDFRTNGTRRASCNVDGFSANSFNDLGNTSLNLNNNHGVCLAASGQLKFSTGIGAGGPFGTALRKVADGALEINNGTNGATSTTSLTVGGFIATDVTVTAAGDTGHKTINTRYGKVRFASGATSLIITNSKVTASSIVTVNIASNDATMKSCVAVPSAGAITLYPNAAPTAEVAVDFSILN